MAFDVVMGGWGGRLELGRVTDGNRRVDGVGGLGWAGGPECMADGDSACVLCLLSFFDPVGGI